MAIPAMSLRKYSMGGTMGFMVFVNDILATGFQKIRFSTIDMENLEVAVSSVPKEIQGLMVKQFYEGGMNGENYIVQIPESEKVECFFNVKKRFRKRAEAKAKEIIATATWGDDY
jgi:hypothetical protein